MATEAQDSVFDVQSHMGQIKTRQGPAKYLPVKYRVMWIRAEHPDARIEVEKVDGGLEAGWVEFKCTITLPSGATATDYASETQADFPDYYEKAATKAIGRACATLGYGTDAAPDLDDGEPLDGAGAAKGERAARREGVSSDRAQRMTNLAQGPQRLANGPTPIRQPGQAMEAVRAISGAHTLDVREESRPSPRAQQQAQQQDGRDAYPYQQIFERKTDMAAVNGYLAEHRLRGGNKGECIRAVNDYAQRTHGAQGDIVIGTGAWNEQYKRNDVYPMDIANALAHYVAQESTAGASEARAAAERDATNDDEWDDVPF